jgi:hypothetical protein
MVSGAPSPVGGKKLDMAFAEELLGNEDIVLRFRGSPEGNGLGRLESKQASIVFAA